MHLLCSDVTDTRQRSKWKHREWVQSHWTSETPTTLEKSHLTKLRRLSNASSRLRRQDPSQTSMSVLLTVGPKYTPAESHAAPWWVTEYADGTDRQTDGRTDGCQTVRLCFPLDMASIKKSASGSGCYLKFAWNIVLVQWKYPCELEALGNCVDWFAHLLGTDRHCTCSNLALPSQRLANNLFITRRHHILSRYQIWGALLHPFRRQNAIPKV